MYLRTVRGETPIPTFSSSSLAMRSSPQQGGLEGHASNEALQFSWNNRSARWGLQAPQQLPGVTVPAKQPFRPHNDQCIPPVEEPGQQYQSNSGDRIDSTRLEATLDVQRQLPSKEEILRFDRSTRSGRQSSPPERSTNQREEDSDGGEHDGIVSYDDRTVTILMTCIPDQITVDYSSRQNARKSLRFACSSTGPSKRLVESWALVIAWQKISVARALASMRDALERAGRCYAHAAWPPMPVRSEWPTMSVRRGGRLPGGKTHRAF